MDHENGNQHVLREDNRIVDCLAKLNLDGRTCHIFMINLYGCFRNSKSR